MSTKIAINGFGRIGRNAFKIAFERSDLEIVAINDLTDTKTLAHLLKHDSNYGMYQHDVGSDDENIIVNGKKIKVLSEKDPLMLPWKDLAVDIVIESTGLFVEPVKAHSHIDAGAKKVIISAPAKGDGADTIVIGVNEDKLKTAGAIISNASCTTNCIAPVMAILQDHIGIEKAMMTTVHAYTASQRLQDAPAKDLREARNAASNIVPTTTGASIAATQAIPALKGLFGGMSIRVPVPVVSISDFTIVTKKTVTVEEVNDIFKKAAADPYYQGIVAATEEELVSSDYIGNSHSAIVDLKLTSVVDGNLLKVMAWYDNEWGYSNRLVEITADAGRLLSGNAPEHSEPAQPAEESHVPEVSESTPEFNPVHEAEKPSEPLLEPPDSAKEELLPAPESLEHKPPAQINITPIEQPKPDATPTEPNFGFRPEVSPPNNNVDGFPKF